MCACELNNQLGRYHDGELAEGPRRAFEQHLARCPECAVELEQLRSISRSLRAEIMPRASAEFMHCLEALASNVEDAMALRFVRRLTAAAAAILLATTLHWAFSHPSSPAIPAPVATIAADERMLVDPESAANNALPDSNALVADAQFDSLANDLTSGGRP